MLLESKPTMPVVAPAHLDRRLIAGIASAMSAAALYFGTGLHPVPWLTWLAFLPILLAAPRLSARAVALAGFGAWLVGASNLWSYLVTIRMPVPLIVAYAIVPALLFVLEVLLARALLVRRRLVLAALAIPACWAATEYLFSILTPDGAFWGLAYTQSDLLAVMQTASLTGPWGVTFLVVGASAAVAAGFAPGASLQTRAQPIALFTLMFALALGYGTVRLHSPASAGRSVQVALVAVRQPGGRVDADTAEGRHMLDEYLKQAGDQARRGAQIVVLPEAVFAASEATLPTITTPFAELAAQTGATILVGVSVTDSEEGRASGYNTAQIFAGDQPVGVYRKQHLILGAERKYLPGRDLVFIPRSGGQLGVEICKDMDYPSLARSYRQRGIQLMLVPAWDFGVDGWLHGRMAVSRGIENGFAVARPGRDGRATISDANGRVLADADTSDATPVVSLTATVALNATATPYNRLGDWFAWLAVAGTLAVVLWLVLTRRQRTSPPIDTNHRWYKPEQLPR